VDELALEGHELVAAALRGDLDRDAGALGAAQRVGPTLDALGVGAIDGDEAVALVQDVVSRRAREGAADDDGVAAGLDDGADAGVGVATLGDTVLGGLRAVVPP
jgi:hypothetical protein